MQLLILALIIATGSFEYLEMQGWFPDGAGFVQEILAVIVAGAIVLMGARSGFHNVHPSYWLVFGGILLLMLCGIIINNVGSGPVFAGLRTYLRAIPLFFLPAVFLMKDRQLRAQFLLLMLLALVQLPISLDQRMTTFGQAYLSGDRTTGTLLSSPTLTIFCACVACVLTGLYMRKRMRGWIYFLLLCAVLAPTMLNETKATLVLVPLGLLTTFIVGSHPRKRLQNGFIAFVLLGTFVTVFVPVYDYFMKPRWGYGIVEFMTMQGRLEGYMDKNAGMGARTVGRVDALVVPVEQLARDPARFAFGYGIGNVSQSSLGSQFTGQYFRQYQPFLLSSSTVVMLETGMLGLAGVLMLMWLILRDSRVVAREDDGLLGAFAVGWIGVTVTMTVAFFYNTVITNGVLSFLFWYFAGHMAAQRMRLGHAAHERTVQETRARRGWKRAHAAG